MKGNKIGMADEKSPMSDRTARRSPIAISAESHTEAGPEIDGHANIVEEKLSVRTDK